MIATAERGPGDVLYLPGRGALIASVAAAGACWLLAAVGLVKVVSALSSQGWTQNLALVVLGLSLVLGAWTTRSLAQSVRVRVAVPKAVLDRRCHGDLDEIVDSERRPLRSIGVPAADVAARTGGLLDDLLDVPSVRIFRGVRSPGPGAGVTAHAIVAGMELILVESVAWPRGRYTIDQQGRLSCDGVYIGQSVAPLIASVRHWRAALPRGHRVSALIVVYSSDSGRPVLPLTATPAGLTWIYADDLVWAVRQRMPRRPSVSRHAVAALAAAVTTPQRRTGGS
jgi:hypothetical protein